MPQAALPRLIDGFRLDVDVILAPANCQASRLQTPPLTWEPTGPVSKPIDDNDVTGWIEAPPRTKEPSWSRR